MTESEHKSEYEAGEKHAAKDYVLGKEMCQTLNFPFGPYARGYFETYTYIEKTNSTTSGAKIPIGKTTLSSKKPDYTPLVIMGVFIILILIHFLL